MLLRMMRTCTEAAADDDDEGGVDEDGVLRVMEILITLQLAIGN